MRSFDFSSWESIVATIIGLALFALIGVGIRLILMVTVQQRQQRMNRQINERLRVLIAAYKVLGGSFTGDLSVNPAHLRQLRQAQQALAEEMAEAADGVASPGIDDGEAADRPRRIRDAVEAALSDIILLGTEEQVRLADKVARELVAGRPVQTHELVVSLRDFIRKALDLEAIPADLALPLQGPTRLAGGAARRGGQGQGGGRQAGGAGGGAGGGGGGMGMGAGRASDDGASGGERS